MEQVKNLLEAREKQLLQLKKEKEKALLKAPEGSLRICRHGDKTQYYHRKDPKDYNGVYIREKEIALAQQLAQKDYDKKVLHSIEKELNAIHRYVSGCPERSAEQIFETLHQERQKLITPIIESDEEYMYNWERVKYQGKEFYEDIPEFYTAKGERVRSKSEVIIADVLNREGVPYRYEYPLYIKGVGNVYPDFTLLNISTRKEILWEHFGMMDDPEYAEKAIQKIITYEQNEFFQGINLILTYETRKTPLNQKTITRKIKYFLTSNL